MNENRLDILDRAFWQGLRHGTFLEPQLNLVRCFKNDELFFDLGNSTDKATIGNNLIPFGKISDEFSVFFGPFTLRTPDD